MGYATPEELDRMTEEQRLERLITSAVKTGKLFVSQDVYDELKKLPTDSKLRDRLGGLEIVVSTYLPKGSVASLDLPWEFFYDQA